MAERQKIRADTPIVIIGGSAGSLTVLLSVLPFLPQDIGAAIVLVTHRHSGSEILLEALLSARASLPVCDIEEKDMPWPGYIYVAPADYHLLFEPDGSFALDSSEKVNYSRPSIDVTFSSAALAYGSNMTALLLSGANTDGTEGLIDVHEAGGTTAVQDPATADVDYMPRQAIQLAPVDIILPPHEMALFINEMAGV